MFLDFGQSCVNAWYSEKNDYDFNNPGFSMNTGHFTQMIWKSSLSIGSGIALGSGNTYFCVTQYSPRGNIFGMDNRYFRDNVLPSQSK
jgi:hypothetical protein